MPVVFRKRWTQKPPPGTPIAWGHPRAWGLAGSWHFNENGGLLVRDAAYNYGHGTIGSGSWSSGPYGVDMSMSSGLVTVTNHPQIDLHSFGLTVEAIAQSSFVGTQIIASKSFASTPFPFILQFVSTSTQIQWSTAVGNAVSVTGLAANTWYHIIATSDAGGNVLDIYINGVLAATGAPSPAALSEATAANIRIGQSTLIGKIALFRVWNRVLQASEALEEYSNPWDICQRNYRIWLPPPPAGPQTITPGAPIPSLQNWFTPVVTAPTPLTITPVAAIPQLRNWYTPTVAGPITLGAAIPSRQSWPTTDFINLEQRLIPAAPIPSRQSWPATDRVAHTITVRPAAPIPSLRTWYAPTVSGNAQFILASPVIRGPRSFPFPTVSGGNADVFLRLYLGGVDVSNRLLIYGANDNSGVGGGVQGGGGNAAPQPVSIESQTIGRWNARFDLYCGDGSFAPAIGSTVLFTEAGRRMFAGCLVKVVTERMMSTVQQIVFHCQAVDKSGICDHRVVKAVTYPAGSDVAATILDICANSLNGEGITTNGVPTDGSLGVLAADLVLNYHTVTQAFDMIGTDSATFWWIDPFADLTFSALTTLPSAPFSLSETSMDWRTLTEEQSLLDYRNSQYAVSNLNTLPSGTAETYTLPQAAAVARNFVFGAIVLNLIPNPIISLTVNGVPKTVKNGFDIGTDLSQFWWYFPALNPFITPPIAGPDSNLMPGDVVAITYVPVGGNAAATVGTALAPTPPPGGPTPPGGTCGSGVYEAVEQVQNISDIDSLNAIAAAVLARRGGVPTILNYETDRYGLIPGQKQVVNIPLTYLPNQELMITAVQMTSLGKDLGRGTTFRSHVRAQSNEDPGNYTKWYERLVQRTQNPLPVYQYEIASFVLAPGSSLSAGLVSMNPYIVKRTGQLWDMYVAAGTPPVDQQLELTLLLNGSPVQGFLVLPAGAPANTEYRFIFGLDSGLYVFSRPAGPNDILTVSAAYRITGASPTAAQNVSFDVRWRI